MPPFPHLLPQLLNLESSPFPLPPPRHYLAVTTAYIPVEVIGGESALAARVGYLLGGGDLVQPGMYQPQADTLEPCTLNLGP